MRSIVLNAKELEVQSAELNGEGDVRVEMDTEHMRVALVPETAVAPGEHKCVRLARQHARCLTGHAAGSP